MQRKIIGIAVLVTIGVLVYLFFPSNFMDYFSNSISPTKEPTSAFVQRTTQPAVTQPSPNTPAPQPAQLPANPAPQPPPKGGHPVSEYIKIRHMAEENHVRILRFDEANIGDATMQVESGDKNNIFDFMDAIERGINLRDMENKSKGYRIMYDRDGRQIVQAVLWIRYIPRFETNP
ncbi:MAG: hypothetical protein ACE14V_08155 [bacterium]